MGSRYNLFDLKCPYCGKKQEEVYYAHSSGFLTKRCEFCRKESIISQRFSLSKATKEEIDNHYRENGFVKE